MKIAVLLNGTGCWIRAETSAKQPEVGRLVRMGFYTTCFVHAGSVDEAIETAVTIVETRLRQIAFNKVNQPWRILAIETREVTEPNESTEPKVMGFAWYTEEDGHEN